MITNFIGDAVAWVLAIGVAAAGGWLVLLGIRMCLRLMNPTTDMLAWYTVRNRHWTIFHVINCGLPGAWGLPYGAIVGGLSLTLYAISWIANKSGLAGLMGTTFHLQALISPETVMFCGLLVIALPLGILMGINAWRRGFVETALAGLAGALAGAWLMYFGYVDSNSLLSFAGAPLFDQHEIPGQGGLMASLVGILMAAVDGIAVSLWFMALSFLAAVINGLLVMAFTRQALMFSVGTVSLGAMALLAYSWAG